MSLNTAHEGYEYQDLLTSFFILKEILNENDSTFKIDTKEYGEDKFDDLTITNSSGTFKKQIKYSNEIINKQLGKEILSSETSYQLALDTLFDSWNNHPDKSRCEVRICLAWQKPIDDLINILKIHTVKPSFSSHLTQLYQIDINKFWAVGEAPLSNWRRFKEKSKNIDRNVFENFCNHLVIETNFPKQSSGISFSGELERIILEQIKRLGVSEYPNNIQDKDFALSLIQLVRRSRSRGQNFKTKDIFSELNIQTNFGAIQQVFPIDEQKNIKPEISWFKEILDKHNQIKLIGEPGSGKSWFVQNLEKSLQQEYKVIRHYCYTELKDNHAKQRITLNVFYGNLINDILQAFPELKQEKIQRYASNLSELNILLQSIKQDTLLIIDGLDHIDRIYEFNRSDLTIDDIAIINSIKQLNFSDKVKILLVSQPIVELTELSDFKEEKIPSWTKTEVLSYFSQNNITNIETSEKIYLSDFFIEKSNGNPLYINYIHQEILKINPISTQALDTLPAYSFNLTNYYDYLISKLNTKESIPRVLSGASFSLSKDDLVEITGEGDYVNEILEKISPILKQNNSLGGYIIYHESFRRFIIEKLQNKKVSVFQTIFKPLIEWFESKGFYEFPKAYRFYLQLLYDNQHYDKILVYLTKGFVNKSVYHGYSFEAVKNNYYYLAKSATKQKNFPKIIQVNELNKILSSTENEYEQGLSLYLTALGYLQGFKKLTDYLVFDGKATLSPLLGLEVCYLCDQHQEPAPWEIYFDYFGKDQSISLSDFKYYVRGNLVFKNTDSLISMAENLTNDFSEYHDFITVFSDELINYHNENYISELKSESHSFEKIINYKSTIKNSKTNNLVSLAQQLLDQNRVSEEYVDLIELFFIQIEESIHEKILIKKIIKLFSGKNWFYNWLIYFIKVKILQTKSKYFYFEVKDAFQYLIYDTNPFKGDPRGCDLYYLSQFIYNSFVTGLKLIKTSEEWTEILDMLTKLSNETTTSLQGSLGGALSTNNLFKLFDEVSSNINREKIIVIFNELILEKENYQFYSYIAEYYFRLSKQYSIVDNKQQAEICYTKGIKYLFSYTFRKDLTIEDIVEAIECYGILDNSEGNKYIRNMKSLIDSVTRHTDGKSTKWFPISWFKKFLTINFDNATTYLLSELKEDSYYWVHEEQLKDLLIKANGDINPIIELFIYRSFITETETDFLLCGFRLVEKVKVIDYELAKTFLKSLLVKCQSSEELKVSKQLNKLLAEFDIPPIKVKSDSAKEKPYHREVSKIELISQSIVQRKNLSDMSIEEKLQYFSEYKVKKQELMSLYYLFDDLTTLTPDTKDLIKTIVEKNHDYSEDNQDLSVVFDKDSEVSAYYWICKFVVERNGWFNSLTSFEAFKHAYQFNAKLAIDSLTELFDRLLELGFHRSVSSNLINTFVKVGYDSETIKKMWQVLYETTELRLPAKEEIDWDNLLSNELNMNTEELLICILFTRFKANTTERHHWTLSGLVYLYEYYPDKMIKPTQWFLRNYQKFLEVNLLVILEIIDDISKSKSEYPQIFESELNKLCSANYYTIDFILKKLISKSSFFLTNPSSLLLEASDKNTKFFSSINYRNYMLYNKDFDFSIIVAKYISSFQSEYAKDFEFLGNHSIKKYVHNIYPANYLLKLINQHLYEEFYESDNQSALFDVLKIHYKLLIAQINSYQQRPAELAKPSAIIETWTQHDVACNDWIRLGYYENEIFEKEYGKSEEHQVFEGVVFSDDIERTMPFSRYALYPQHIFENMSMRNLDESLCLHLFQQQDHLENYQILWLNSIVINELNLKINNPLYGLSASNENNEIVLKYNRWCCDYLGNERISDEIPKLEGGELICRRDYFEKICKTYQNLSSEKIVFKKYRIKIPAASSGELTLKRLNTAQNNIIQNVI